MFRTRNAFHSRQLLRIGAHCLALMLILSFVACSSSRRMPVGGGLTGGDNSNLFDDIDNTDNTGGGTTPTFDENLFDNELGAGENSDFSGNLGDVTPTESQCLTQDSALGVDFGGYGFGSNGNVGTGSTQLAQNAACFQPGYAGQNTPYFNPQTGTVDPMFLFDYAVGSFGAMDTCVQLAAMVPQYVGAQASSNWDAVFQAAQMGMVRCFRRILQQQQQVLPWGSTQQQAFGYVDHNLWQLMVIFGNHR